MKEKEENATYVIGAALGVDIRIDKANVSSRHARLTRVGRGYLLEDLQSTNGTFVDGNRINTRAVTEASRIGLGSHVVTLAELLGMVSSGGDRGAAGDRDHVPQGLQVAAAVDAGPGGWLNVSAATNLVACAACGNMVSTGAGQCTRCGHPVRQQAQPLQVQQPQYPQAYPPPQPPAYPPPYPQAYPPPQVQARKGPSLLTAFVVVAAVVCAAWLGIRALSLAANGTAGTGPGILGAIEPTQVVLDEHFAVDALDSYQMRGFLLPTARRVQVVVQGERNTGKGFTVYVMDQENYELFKSGAEFQQFSQLKGLQTVSVKKEANLPAGTYCVVVVNSENILNTMVVHVQVVVNPS